MAQQKSHKASNKAFQKAYQAYRMGQMQPALEFCNEAVRAHPKNIEALHLAAVIFASAGNFLQAIPFFERVVALQPANAEAMANLARSYYSVGRLEDALALFERAIRLNPRDGMTFYNQGLALVKVGKLKEAFLAFKRAHELMPNHQASLAEACRLVYHQLSVEESKKYFERMLSFQHSAGLYVTYHLLLPPILPSEEAIDTVRKEHERSINKLMQEDLKIEQPYRELLRTSFYLAYHGKNNKELMQKLVGLYYKICPSLKYTAPHCQRERKDGKIKVGVISKYFHRHSVSLCFSDVIKELAKMPEFEVHMICTDQSPKIDSSFNEMKEVCNSYVQVPQNIEEAQQAVANLELDILIFTELGMDGLAYYLAFSRLARAQVLFGGHPDTSGIPTVDYAVSSSLLEADNAQEHHTEKLLLLDGLAVSIPHMKVERPKTRKELGLPEEGTLYMCPMKLQKMHPEFDGMLREILERDKKGYLVLFRDNLADWHLLLMERFKKTIRDEELLRRVLFLPFIEPSLFPHYLARADVVLDTIHFGGGTTSFMALGIGTPMVTLPGEFSRARPTYSCYKLMGMDGLVAKDKEDYVRLALKLGQDKAFNTEVRKKISSLNSVLFENVNPAQQLAAKFKEILA